MMIGSRVRYCVTYKTGDKSFNVFRAKYIHNFKVTVENMNLEGSKGCELQSINAFLCSRSDGVQIYDSTNYRMIGDLKGIKLLKPPEG